MSRIIDDNTFESLRLFDENSNIHHVVSPMLENVFEKLFNNTEANPKDFYFTIFDDEHPNAFFINKENTLEKNKHIIAVSRGLINECNNEAELAGILGHECGHYLWAELLKGENTIFQEHAADLRAVDLLINGGYNPRHHLEICTRILGDYGHVRYQDISINVHGNGLARVDDIKDYMTKIANEKGDFPPLDGTLDDSYLGFRDKVKNIYETEGFDTYIEKCLKRDFGTKDLNEINVKDVLSMFLNEMNEGNISIEKHVRFNEMYNIISKYSSNKAFDDKSEELTVLCQNFFLKMHEMVKNTDFREFRHIDRFEEKCQDRTKNVLYMFKLKKFGDFVKQTENIEHFVNYKDKDDAIYWAKEMYKLSWTLPYAHSFTDDEYPRFTPKKEDNVGKKLPWDELFELNLELKSEELRWAISTLYYDNSYSYQKRYSSQEYDSKDYFLDKNKVVIAYGEEAKKMHEDASLYSKKKSFLNECDYCFYRFKENIDFCDLLAEFSISDDIEKKKELADKIILSLEKDKYFSSYSITYFDSRGDYSLYWLKNPHIDKIKERYENSLFKKHFISPLDEDSRALAHKVIDKEKNDRLNEAGANNIDAQKYIDDLFYIKTLTSDTTITSNTNLQQSIGYSLLKLGDFVQKYDEEKAFVVFDSTKGLLFHDFYHPARYLDGEDKKAYNHLETIFEKNQDLLRDNYYRVSQVNPSIILKKMLDSYNGSSTLDHLTMGEFEIKHFNSSPTLERAMKVLGFNPENSFSENMMFLDKTIGPKVKVFKYYDRYSGDNVYQDKELQGSLYDEPTDVYQALRLDGKQNNVVEFVKDAGFLMLANTIKKGNDYDLKEAMKYLHHSRYCSYYEPLINDMLALSIQKDNKFSKMSLEDKIYVYEVMDEKGVFSEKYANKIEFFREIVNDIVNEKDNKKAVKYAELLLSQQYVGENLNYNDNRKPHDIEFHKEKDILIDFYAKSKSDELGIDDGSDDFCKRASLVAEDLCERVVNKYGHKSDKFSRDTLNAILDRISTNVVSQELTAQMLRDKGKITISGRDAQKYDYHARAMLAVVSALAKNPDNAKVVVDFLSTKCTDESINMVFEKIPEEYNLRKGKEISLDYGSGVSLNTKLTFDKSTLVMLHENFWHASLPARAYVMKRILNAYASHEKTPEDKKNKKLDLVVDMFFDEKSTYYKDAKQIVHAIYDNLQDYEQDLILGALVSANQKGEDKDKKLGGEAIGEGLKMFFENKGPAFVKFGQMLSYLPQLDPEIRKPLAKLRDKADIPSRAELFDLLKETLPNEELGKISRVDKILGAGSFFITTKIKYEGKDCVVAVMRPFAKELSQSGMNMINNTIECLAKQDSKYEPLRNIAYQAKISAESETDIDADYSKYREAIRIYDDVKITTPVGEFTPNVQKWESYGAGKDGKVYKVMDMASGLALTSDKMTEQQKHDMAVAYTTLELCNLLSGQRWDTDRHQGQQNFIEKSAREDGFKKFMIGIFDTGAQIQHDPSKRDKIMLGELLYGMIRASRTGKNIAEYMIGKVKQIDKVGGLLNIDTLYIDEVQRGLTALSDIITYQKEKKDEKGNVIQKEKSLSAEEIGQIAGAIMESGLIDEHVLKTIKAKAILNKLRPLRKGWISSLGEGIKKISSTIKIEKRADSSKDAIIIARKVKPQDEIDTLNKDENNVRVLGVDVTHLRLKEKETSPSLKGRLAAFNERIKS